MNLKGKMMNKKMLLLVLGSWLSIVCSPTLFAQEGVQSLRGGTEILADSVTPRLSKWRHDAETIARQYVQQPPLIPHKVDGYKINKKFNKCLTCHSWSNYKASGATKVGQSHFLGYDGAEQANLAGRRYFCLQCHVPQKQIDPLVGNSFKPIDILDQY